MSKPLRGIMFDNTSGDLSNNLGLGDAALTHLTSGADNIAVGYNALQTTTTGSSNVAIGNQAASDSNYSNTITINATGNSLDTTNDSGCFVAPIRNASAAYALYYDNTTKEITWDASGGGGGGIGNLVSGNLLVTGTAEAKGDLLPPVQSAEGSSQSVITDLDPNTNPLMTKGMLWMNEAQEASGGWYADTSYNAVFAYYTILNAAAALGGKIYMAGGQGGSGYNVDSARAYVYDPIDNSWNAITPMDISRGEPGGAALGGKFYVVGGISGTWDDALPAMSSAEVYDPKTNSWSAIASMNIARRGCAAASLGGLLYVTGGSVGGASNAATLNSCEIYDPINNSWNMMTPMQSERYHHALVARSGCLYAVGGTPYDDDFSELPSIEKYDPATEVWTLTSTTQLIGFGAKCPSVAALGGTIYIIGGNHGTGSSTEYNWDVYASNAEGPPYNWRQLPPTLGDAGPGAGGGGPALTKAVALGGKIYVVGGGAGVGVQVYDPSLVPMPQITYQGEDFYISHQRGGPKTFVIPHPEHEGKMLRHACLEAPTRGTNVYEYQITTTEDNQTTTISLPSYFKHINGSPNVFVSPKNVLSTCYGNVNDDLTAALITTEKPGTFNVMVTGVRKDPDAVAYSATEHIDEPIAADDIPSSGTNA